MSDRKAADCGQWVMLDDNGQRTLFQLVEMGKGADAVQLARELAARTVVVDIALPALPAVDEESVRGRPAPSSRLILVKVRTVGSNHANAGVVRLAGQQSTPAGMAEGVPVD